LNISNNTVLYAATRRSSYISRFQSEVSKEKTRNKIKKIIITTFITLMSTVLLNGVFLRIPVDPLNLTDG